MYIYLLTNEENYITGFISHIKKPYLFDKRNLRKIDENDYLPLLYFMSGRTHVKETHRFPTAKFGELSLRDDGDYTEQHMRDTKRIMELNYQ